MANSVREPAVAGLFYSANPATLGEEVQRYIAQGTPSQAKSPKALIAPHAGYRYSGPVAGSAYAQLRDSTAVITRVVILAPAHRIPFGGIAYSTDTLFRTPLGSVPVDSASLREVSTLPQLRELDAAFENEHSIEVQLPFLQKILLDFSIVPLLIGDTDYTAVAEVLEKLWGGPETLIVISSDLSHYLSYRDAQEMDRKTTRAIEQLNPSGVGNHHACGRIPVNGLLLAARQRHLRATTIDVRNSGDTAGSKDRVVGYGAYVFD